MRISDWSSDVCSSDLKGVSRAHHHDRAGGMAGHPGGVGPEQIVAELGPVRGHDDEIDAVAFRKSQDLLVDGRSAARRVGKEWYSTCRSLWSPSHETNTRHNFYISLLTFK